MDFMVKYFVIFLTFNVQAFCSDGKDWWKYTMIYEIYLPSFKDSNGDGIGDLKGVTSMLDHLVDLGVETVWITPFFKSTMVDMGYDVENYSAIEPTYGTMEDFEELMKELKNRGLRLIVDFVINHTSDKCSWFTKSIDRIEPYTDFYVWKDAKHFEKNGEPVPPNNWIGIYEGSAWTWNEKRKQFYYHQFVKTMPDLNLRNPTLINEIKKILKYWFNKGVAGLRLDAAPHFMEDLKLRDEPLLDPNNHQKYIRYEHLNHIYTKDHNDSYVFIHELKEFVDSACSRKNDEKILIPETSTDDAHVMKYYGTPDYKISNFPINFHFISINNYPTANDFDFLIQSWLTKMPAHGVANWGFENHDQLRVGKRFNAELSDILLITVMMLPGVTLIYYGQEIGMVNNKVRAGETRIPNSYSVHHWDTPDEARLPMQWDNTRNAGFTSNSKPWLPINPDYWHVNVEAQKHQPNSRYKLFKILSNLRRTGSRKFGDFKSYIFSHWVYGFSRQRIKTKPKFPREITLRPFSGIVLSTLDIIKSIPKFSNRTD